MEEFEVVTKKKVRNINIILNLFFMFKPLMFLNLYFSRLLQKTSKRYIISVDLISDKYVLSVTSTVDNLTQQEKATFPLLHDQFYEWYTPHVQHLFRALLTSNVADNNKPFIRTAFGDDTPSRSSYR